LRKEEGKRKKKQSKGFKKETGKMRKRGFTAAG
jgi:hypothetical protein